MKDIRWIPIGIIAALGAAGVWFVVPNLTRGRVTESKWSCRGNLTQLEGALNEYAADKKLPSGTPVSLNELSNHFSSPMMFKRSITCLAGGHYPNPLIAGKIPTCSLAATNAPLHDQQWDQEWDRRVRLYNGWRLPWEKSPKEVWGF